MVHYLARLVNQPVVTIQLNSATDQDDLMGTLR